MTLEVVLGLVRTGSGHHFPGRFAVLIWRGLFDFIGLEFTIFRMLFGASRKPYVEPLGMLG
jgi:hypothetical protein